MRLRLQQCYCMASSGSIISYWYCNHCQSFQKASLLQFVQIHSSQKHRLVQPHPELMYELHQGRFVSLLCSFYFRNSLHVSELLQPFPLYPYQGHSVIIQVIQHQLYPTCRDDPHQSPRRCDTHQIEQKLLFWYLDYLQLQVWAKYNLYSFHDLGIQMLHSPMKPHSRFKLLQYSAQSHN